MTEPELTTRRDMEHQAEMKARAANEVERVKAMLTNEADTEGECIACHSFGPLWTQPYLEPRFAYCWDCWQKRLANTETAQPAQPRTWDDWEQRLLHSVAYDGLDSGPIHIKSGIRLVFGMLRREFPPAATCQASGELLKALKAADRVLDWARVVGRLNSVDGGLDKPCEMVIEQMQAAIALAEPTP